MNEAKHNAYLGDVVETALGQVGRVYQVHYRCPESQEWRNQLGIYDELTEEEREGKGRWVSVLVHDGGAVTYPDRLVRVLPNRAVINNSMAFYFRPEAR